MADFEVVRRDSDKKILKGAFGDLSGAVGSGETRFVLTDGSADWNVLDGVEFDIDQVKFDGGDNVVLKTAGEVLRNEIAYELTDDAAAHDTATGFPELDADGASFFTVTIQKQDKDQNDLTDAGDTDILELRATGGFITNTSDVVIDSITLVAGTAQFRFHSTFKTHAAQIQVISNEDDVADRVTSLGVFLKDGGTSDAGPQRESKPMIFRGPVGAGVVEVDVSGDAVALELPPAVPTAVISSIIIPKKVLSGDIFEPFRFQLAFVVTAVGGGDANVRLKFSAKSVASGEVPSSIGGVSNEFTEAVTNTLNRIHNLPTSLVAFAVSNTNPDEHMMITLERLGGDGADTFTGTIGLLTVAQVSYVKLET